MVNATVTRVTATVAALVLVVSAFAGGAAAAGADADLRERSADVSVPDEAKTTTCLQVYAERSVGPVTVIYYCGLDAEIDESWEPSDELPSASTSSGEPACFDIYYERSVGPVTYKATSSCDHQVTIDSSTSSSSSAIPPCGSGGEVSAGPAAAGYDPYCQIYVNVDGEWRPSDETTQPNCFYLFWEQEAGPVTVTLTSTCSGSVDVDENWSPTDETTIPLDHMSPSDDPVKCFLDADSGVERWACFFGPPGP